MSVGNGVLCHVNSCLESPISMLVNNRDSSTPNCIQVIDEWLVAALQTRRSAEAVSFIMVQ